MINRTTGTRGSVATFVVGHPIGVVGRDPSGAGACDGITRKEMRQG